MGDEAIEQCCVGDLVEHSEVLQTELAAAHCATQKREPLHQLPGTRQPGRLSGAGARCVSQPSGRRQAAGGLRSSGTVELGQPDGQSGFGQPIDPVQGADELQASCGIDLPPIETHQDLG